MAEPFIFVRPEVLSCAVRYALGRRSYIVGTIADQVRSTWNDLGEQRNVIREDVQSWLVEANAKAEIEGGEVDEYDTWLELWRWMQDRATAHAARSESDV